MSADNKNAHSHREIQRLIDETRQAIRNTQKFLDQLDASDEPSREHVRRSVQDLEQRLERLRSK